ncbi:MAG: hypothetical protein C4524_00855 [Candidatus Zixiibacteriota bacterium]|nr:MAG: hypothetical protein C4524_00855 [candidate division Zixibacteria bacterium]
MVFLLLAILGWLIFGCGSGRPRRGSKAESEPGISILDTLKVPTGVDTLVAVSAALAANRVMVGAVEESLATDLYQRGLEQSTQGKPVWDLLRQGMNSPEELPPEDTLKNIELFNQGVDQAERADKVLKGHPSRLTPAELRQYPEALRHRAAQYYEQARDLFERALKYNPWDLYARGELINTYMALGDLQLSLENYDEAIAAIENFLELDASRYDYRALLGDAHAARGDTLQALIEYRRAEDALLAWAPTPLDPAGDVARAGLDPQEYQDWIGIIYRQCTAELALEQSASALAELHRLLAASRPEYPSDSAFARYASNTIDWLMWDGGDIRAARLRNQVYEAGNQENWAEARRLVSQLLPRLDRREARFEIEKYAASVDFYRLALPDSALQRMRRLVNESGFAEMDADLDSLIELHGPEGFAEKMAWQRAQAGEEVRELLDLYGDMCVTYANEVFEARLGDRKTAYIYYFQAALIPWDGQAYALFCLADLARNQADRVVLYGESALRPELISGLKVDNLRNLYTLLLNAYRRLNDRPHAQYYLNQLTALQQRAPEQPNPEDNPQTNQGNEP